MKKLFLNVFLACLVLVILQACKKDEEVTPTPADPDPITITAENFTANIAENPMTADMIGTVSASASDGSALTYTLSNENVMGALAIDANTGALTVADASAFDFETNPSITANYTASNGTEEATASITITVNDVSESTAFITTWETTTTNESITIPTRPGFTYNYTVEWGDGNMTTETGDATHTYTDAGTYQVSITGTFPTIYSSNSTDANRAKLKSIDNWGSIAWQNMENAFFQCENLGYNASDAPDLSNVGTMKRMFFDAISFNGDLSNWDVSNITDMGAMFTNASSFNGDISTWDVSSVSNMNNMFSAASAFNQDISNWNVSSVSNMNNMFSAASVFNQNIGSWNVGNVVTMRSMFERASTFNQDISGWNVGNVTNMEDMFSNASAFNQDISGWNVGNVTTMRSMFNQATVFNANISGWNVSNVTNMGSMFRKASAFNQDISSWIVSNVTNMRSMFDEAVAFDQNIGSWNVSNVTNMAFMFFNTSTFNQDISSWIVTNVTDMSFMFRDASAFNQNISGWNTINVTSCGSFATGSPIDGTSNVPTAGSCF